MTAREPGRERGLDRRADRRPRATAFRASSPAPTMTVGLEVLVQDVIAAIATEPVADRRRSPPTDLDRRHGRARRPRRRRPGRRRWKFAGRSGEQDPVLRPARAGDGRLDGREVELRSSSKVGPGARLAPQALRLGVALDEATRSGGPAGQAQVGERLVVDREERRGRPELGAHVADRRPVGQRQAGQPVAGELDERPDDAVRAEHLGDDEDEVGRGRAARQLAVEADADDVRHRLVERLAEEDRLGLDAADAVAQDAEAVDHRRVRVGPDERVREGDPAAVVVRRGPRRPWPGTRG